MSEVEHDHPVYELIASLNLASVETKHVKLSGLTSKDLNVMISEFLCLNIGVLSPFFLQLAVRLQGIMRCCS